MALNGTVISDDLNSRSIVGLLERFRGGDREAAAQLVTIFYDELRRIAAGQMRGERAGHTLQPTALVSELYFKILQQKPLPSSSGPAEDRMRTKGDFLGLARYLMAQILIEYGRATRAHKRRHVKAQLEEAHTVAAQVDAHQIDVLSALDALASLDPDLRSVVDLRFSCGYSIAETARLLRRGQTQVKADWRVAKLWLQRLLGPVDDAVTE
jgi:RNA polymerase sigma factor (TIGR02999 family)